MKFLRWFVGRLVLGYDALTRPKPVKRNSMAQAELDAKTSRFALYQFNACPFCVKVRRELRRHAIKIELRDARKVEAHKQALIEGGGRYKVPCLQISNEKEELTWLYESDEIINYLKKELNIV